MQKYILCFVAALCGSSCSLVSAMPTRTTLLKAGVAGSAGLAITTAVFWACYQSSQKRARRNPTAKNIRHAAACKKALIALASTTGTIGAATLAGGVYALRHPKDTGGGKFQAPNANRGAGQALPETGRQQTLGHHGVPPVPAGGGVGLAAGGGQVAPQEALLLNSLPTVHPDPAPEPVAGGGDQAAPQPPAHRVSAEEEDPCCICFADFEDGDTVAYEACCRVLTHARCYSAWQQSRLDGDCCFRCRTQQREPVAILPYTGSKKEQQKVVTAVTRTGWLGDLHYGRAEGVSLYGLPDLDKLDAKGFFEQLALHTPGPGEADPEAARAAFVNRLLDLVSRKQENFVVRKTNAIKHIVEISKTRSTIEPHTFELLLAASSGAGNAELVTFFLQEGAGVTVRCLDNAIDADNWRAVFEALGPEHLASGVYQNLSMLHLAAKRFAHAVTGYTHEHIQAERLWEILEWLDVHGALKDRAILAPVSLRSEYLVGSTPLTTYCSHLNGNGVTNNTLLVQGIALLATPTNINAVDSEGNDALAYAVRHNRVSAVQELLARGASVSDGSLRAGVGLSGAQPPLLTMIFNAGDKKHNFTRLCILVRKQRASNQPVLNTALASALCQVFSSSDELDALQQLAIDTAYLELLREVVYSRAGAYENPIFLSSILDAVMRAYVTSFNQGTLDERLAEIFFSESVPQLFLSLEQKKIVAWLLKQMLSCETFPEDLLKSEGLIGQEIKLASGTVYYKPGALAALLLSCPDKDENTNITLFLDKYPTIEEQSGYPVAIKALQAFYFNPGYDLLQLAVRTGNIDIITVLIAKGCLRKHYVGPPIYALPPLLLGFKTPFYDRIRIFTLLVDAYIKIKNCHTLSFVKSSTGLYKYSNFPRTIEDIVCFQDERGHNVLDLVLQTTSSKAAKSWKAAQGVADLIAAAQRLVVAFPRLVAESHARTEIGTVLGIDVSTIAPTSVPAGLAMGAAAGAGAPSSDEVLWDRVSRAIRDSCTDEEMRLLMKDLIRQPTEVLHLHRKDLQECAQVYFMLCPEAPHDVLVLASSLRDEALAQECINKGADVVVSSLHVLVPKADFEECFTFLLRALGRNNSGARELAFDLLKGQLDARVTHWSPEQKARIERFCQQYPTAQ